MWVSNAKVSRNPPYRAPWTLPETSAVIVVLAEKMKDAESAIFCR